MYLFLLLLYSIFSLTYAPINTSDGKFDMLFDDEFGEFGDENHFTLGDVHSRFERAVVLAAGGQKRKIIVIKKKRRQHIIHCCGRNKCRGRKRTSPVTVIFTPTTPTKPPITETTLEETTIEETTTTTIPTTTTTQPTTTTKCVPPCPACNPRNATLWNTFGNLINSYEYGTWAVACNKSYLFSSTTSDFQTALATCCNLGMSLISVETQADQLCIHDANNALNASAIKGTFWTSAWDDTCIPTLVFQWCGRNKPMTDTFWMTGEPSGGDDKCVSINVDKGAPVPAAMNDKPCDTLYNYMCEGSPTTCVPECPVVACTTLPPLFKANTLLDPYSIGDWKTPLYPTCDNKTLYLFTNANATFTDALKFCCSIGMKLLSIDTAEEHKCLTDLNNADMKYAAAKYWTSGSNLNCKSVYKWCSANVDVYKGIAWGPNQPDMSGNIEWCAEIILNTGADSLSVLNDLSCGTNNKYICEGATTTCFPECPVVECTTIPTLYSKSGALINPYSIGDWKTPLYPTCDNKTLYLFTNANATFTDALKFCCSIGMKLLSIDTAEEHKCLTDLNNADMKYAAAKYWTSGSNLNCKSVYKWCSANVDVYKGIAWGPNQPDMSGNIEWCAEIILNTGADSLSVLNDLSCGTNNKYICEGATTTCFPECPVVECTTIPTLYTKSGALINADAVGLWKVPINPTCDKKTLYLFSTALKNFTSAMSYCCQIGMKLLSIDTQLEHQCLTDLNNADMKQTEKYWTSGSNLNCKTGYKWCAANTDIYKGIAWASGRPNRNGNKEWCSELQYNTGVDSKSVLNDVDCAANKKFICEGSTTTCKPDFPVVECTTMASMYNNSKLILDPEIYGTWKIPRYSTCDNNTMYLFSSGPRNFSSAMAFCCQVGMKFLSIETPDEHKCITDLNNDKLKYAAVIFWTSATNLNCKPRYQWSGSDTDVVNAIWGPGEPNMATNEWCADISLNTGDDKLSIMRDFPCSESKRFICEGTTTTCYPECPVVECTTVPGLFRKDGRVASAYSSGTWKSPAYPSCDKKTLYVFTSDTKSFLDAMKYCCSIGMSLLSIETPEEHLCLTDLNNAEMKWTDTFWTSGTNLKCKDGYKWCTANTDLYPDIPWVLNQPDNWQNNEWCAVFNLDIGADNKSLLNDIDCATGKRYICEGPTTTCIPECPVFDCTTVPPLFAKDGRLTTPNSIGTWKDPMYSTCDNETSYVFINNAKSFDDAMKYCCSIGMSLLSIETADEHKCLTDLNDADLKVSDNYWTSASNLNCISRYFWCSSKIDLYKEIPWGAGQPNFAGYTEWCSVIALKSGAVNELHDFQCSEGKKFICEGPTTTCSPECPVVECTTVESMYYSNKQLKNDDTFGVWKVPKYPTCDNKTLYLFSNGGRNFKASMEFCCQIGMQLLSIETVEEHQCLSDLNNAEMKWSTMFWTSACDFNCMNQHKWCSANTSIYKGFPFRPGEPNHYGGSQWHCQISISTGPLTNMALDDYNEGAGAQFICEGLTTTCFPDCPPVDCTTVPSMYGLDGEVATPASAGVWKQPQFATCDKKTLYFFSYGGKSVADATNYCCSIGMKLLSIEIADEYKCITDLNNAELGYNVDFWTSGSNYHCKSGYKWCMAKVDLYKGINWGGGQPDNWNNIEWCAEIKLKTGADTASFLNDLDCNAGRRFICEGPTTTTTTCQTPTCTDIPCDKDDLLFDAAGAVKSPAQYGTWVTACGTNLMFSSATTSYCTARKLCCRLGMQLISIETTEKLNCIFDLAAANKVTHQRYRTSLRASIIKTGFEWCPSKNPFDNSRWLSTSPDNGLNPELTGYFFLDGSRTGTARNSFDDAPANYPLAFICEDP